MRLNSYIAASLLASKRRFSRPSWLNALTTRMPGIVSDRMSVSPDHFRHARANSRWMRSPCRKIDQHSSGTGRIMTRPSCQSRLRSTALSPASITADSDTSTIPNARNSHSRSVSELTRVMSPPVFFRA